MWNCWNRAETDDFDFNRKAFKSKRNRWNRFQLWNRWNWCEIGEIVVKSLKLMWNCWNWCESNAKQCEAMQGNPRQCKAIQGSARQYKAMQGNARQCKEMQGNGKQGKAWQSKAKLNTFRHNLRFRWNCSVRFQRFLFDFNDFLSISLKLFFSISTIFFQFRWNCFFDFNNDFASISQISFRFRWNCFFDFNRNNEK